MAAPEIFGGGAAAAKTRILKPRIAVQFAMQFHSGLGVRLFALITRYFNVVSLFPNHNHASSFGTCSCPQDFSLILIAVLESDIPIHSHLRLQLQLAG